MELEVLAPTGGAGDTFTEPEAWAGVCSEGPATPGR